MRTARPGHEAWVTALFGRRSHGIFFKAYTEKGWGVSSSQIQADWAAHRIKNLSLASAVRRTAILRRCSTPFTQLVATARREASTAVTAAPRRAVATATAPLPAPTSSTRHQILGPQTGDQQGRVALHGIDAGGLSSNMQHRYPLSEFPAKQSR